MMNKKTFFTLYYNLVHFLLFLNFFSSGQVPEGGLSDDRRRLISFRNSLPSPAHLPTWDPSTSPCDFSAVSCTDSRVSSINLSSYNLSIDFSKVATFLFPLENLESLVLRKTNLSGTFSPPPGFSCASSLNYLDLSQNAISGPVSGLAFLGPCSNLVSLNLSRNSIGPFVKERNPPQTLRLPSLKVLDVSYNLIAGENVVSWILSGDVSHLNLKGNKLSGNLPNSIPFANLEFLDLSLNNFSSEFPSIDDCSNLRHLDLSSNNFYGEIGESFSSCLNLSFLNLTGNHFTGRLPDMPRGGSIGFLYLRENDFGGLLPSNLPGWCKTLVEFDLSYNNLTGEVPETLSTCSGLHLLDISHNNFSGELPVDTLLELTSLKMLALSFNNFVGGLSDSFSKFVDLEVLDLSSNNMSGPIPDTLCQGGRTSLKVLYLQNNMLGGTIPHSLSNCSRLESLDLSFNYLTGTIPYTLGSLPNLRDIIMWLNELHGQIPQELMHLQSLEKLILDFNYLTGPIPDGLSNCSNLNWISLSSNELSGEIPPSLGRLANLEILKLGNNSLSGRIPEELGDCLSLIWLDLNTNFFNGTIPPALFKQSGNIATALVMGQRYVDIKNDGTKQCHGVGNLLEFEGIRRDQLDRVSARYPCKLSRVYKGNIQPTFDHNGSMLFLDLSYNRLSGILPKELGSMFYLFVLSLGHNDLSGPIPQELGGLRSLAILDLSYNQLNGTIPQSMTSLSFGDIDLSNNQLSGRIPEMAPFDTIPSYRFVNNSGLCGYPLQSCNPPFSPNNDRGKAARGKAYLAGSVAVGLLFSLLFAFGLIFFAVETRKRWKKREAALDAYMENHSNSATAHSVWKLGTREALSISIATFDKPLRKLTFADLLEATNGFHHGCLVGSGGFGDVYKAQLKDGSVVAIKKLIQISGQGDREFTAEMETIGRIKHRNLVPLLGYCKVGEERLLVYEYMKYGSLNDVLHDKQRLGIRLSWRERRRIAVGAARGLAFLHHSCTPHIIHRDMKSSNILLDENLEARVSDFGMARTMMNAMDTHLSVSTLAGTPGYVPPEYYQSFQCSTKGDVYSYGVVLLELLTGRQPTDSSDFGDNNLVGWVMQHAKMRICDVFDRTMIKEDPSIKIELLQHLNIACACLHDRPRRRPTMIQVLAMFKEIQAGSGVDSSSSVRIDGAGFGAAEGIEMSIKEGNELSSEN